MRSCCVVLGDQDGWGTNRLSKAESILGTGMSQNLSRGRRHAWMIYLEDQPDTVHPHGCGEHLVGIGAWWYVSGSSPRVWGTQAFTPVRAAASRFIPTGVGNTGRPPVAISHSTVHPHGCGEHAVLSPRTTMSSGSSPRVWGTRQHFEFLRNDERFIPTGVGNTRTNPIIQKSNPVHPHGCGEHPTSWRR